MEIKEGQMAVFDCVIGGYPRPEISWWKGDIELSHSKKYSIVLSGDAHSLIINDAILRDSGIYHCKAVNSVGQQICTTELIIHERAPVKKIFPTQPSFVTALADADVREGDAFTLECDIANVLEVFPKVEWFLNERPISEISDAEWTQSVDGTTLRLTIPDCLPEDSGVFSVRVTNIQTKEFATMACLVNVRESKSKKMKGVPPAFETTLQDCKIPSGGDAVFECKASGDPLPTCTWTYEGRVLNVARMKHLKSIETEGVYRLVISDALSADAGQYGCQLSNGNGDDVECVATLKITAKRRPSQEPEQVGYVPMFTKKLRGPSEVFEGESAKFTCRAIGMPEPEIKWFKDDKLIDAKSPAYDARFVISKDGTNYVLTVIQVCGDDAGRYSCEIFNSAGKASSFTTLDVSISTQKKTSDSLDGRAPQAIVDKPILNFTDDTTARLSWTPSRLRSHGANSEITYTIEERCLPGASWHTIASGVKACEHLVKELDLKKDYMYRIYAVNEWGTSEPSMPVSTYQKRNRGRSRSRTPESFGYDARAQEIPPQFLAPDDETVYAVLGRKLVFEVEVFAKPIPTVFWYKDEEKIDLGGRVSCTISDRGTATFVITDVEYSDAGNYKCFIENAFGKAEKFVKLEIADPPTFLEPLADLSIEMWQSGRLECAVDGLPYPSIKWHKDWRCLPESSRIKPVRTDYDRWILSIEKAILRDEGLYIIEAENIAGKSYCTAKITVKTTSSSAQQLQFKPFHVEDHFHILEEIGRGQSAVIRRVIEKSTGNEFAAKFIRCKDDQTKAFFRHEFDAMRRFSHQNISAICDAYETQHSLILIETLSTGEELFQRVLNSKEWNEAECAVMVRQILRALQHIHQQDYVYLHLKPENFVLQSSASEVLRFVDFGYARKQHPHRDLRVNFGDPEFVSPEVVNDEAVKSSADMWSVGACVYTLLIGQSPFWASNDRQTLERIKIGDIKLENDLFNSLSHDARDFIKKLIVLDPSQRMTAEQALHHPWLFVADKRGGDRPNLLTTVFYDFQARRKIKRSVTATRHYASYTNVHDILAGSELAIGAETIEQLIKDQTDDDFWTEWFTRYQQGPGTLLIPLNDTEMPVRLRGYARNRDPLFGNKDAQDIYGVDPNILARMIRMKTLKERRIIGEVDEEKDTMAPNLQSNVPESVRKAALPELNARPFTIRKAQTASATHPPIFKQKIKNKALDVGESVSFSCKIEAKPRASMTWYRNDELLSIGGRIRMTEGDSGRCILTITISKPHDAGVYRCVARNKHGMTSCRARLFVGDVPGRPGRPVVAQLVSTQAFIIWDPPTTDGNYPITSYRVDLRKLGDLKWTTCAQTIDECALITGLEKDTTFIFRASAHNKFGQSQFSFASVHAHTSSDAEEIKIDPTAKWIMVRSEQGVDKNSPAGSRSGSNSPTVAMSRETSMVPESKESTPQRVVQAPTGEVRLRDEDPTKEYDFGVDIWKGTFTGHTVKQCTQRLDGEKCIAKIIPYTAATSAEASHEFSILTSLREEHIVSLKAAFITPDEIVMIMERLYGEDIVTYLCYKHKYSEDVVSRITIQLLEALQYLRQFCVVHLQLKPDNILMASRRRLHVKLCDFSKAIQIDSSGEVLKKKIPLSEFTAPEIIEKQKVTFQTDLWSVGVMIFVLLSGESAFHGKTEDELTGNITNARYDAHQLYDNITKDSFKFVYQLMKRNPSERLTDEEALEHKWLSLSDGCVAARKAAVFTTNRLRNFAHEYHVKTNLLSENTEVM